MSEAKKKRGAEEQLTQDNWEREDEEGNVGEVAHPPSRGPSPHSQHGERTVIAESPRQTVSLINHNQRDP